MTNEEAALLALKQGIIVKLTKRNEDGSESFDAFFGEDLRLVFYKDKYRILVTHRQGFLEVDDYGKTWMLRPDEIYGLTYGKTDMEMDILLQELFEENFN